MGYKGLPQLCVQQYLLQPGKDAQRQRVIALESLGQLPQCPGFTPALHWAPEGFGDPGGGSLSCSKCLHNVILTGQGVHSRMLFKQKEPPGNQPRQPSNSLSLRGERFPL